MSLKDYILAIDDLPKATVSIPEWKDAEGKAIVLTVKSLMASERDAFEREMLNKKSEHRNVRASYAAKCIVDHNGDRIFSDTDIEALGKKNANALDRVFAAVLKMNPLTEADVDELKKN